MMNIESDSLTYSRNVLLSQEQPSSSSRQRARKRKSPVFKQSIPTTKKKSKLSQTNEGCHFNNGGIGNNDVSIRNHLQKRTNAQSNECHRLDLLKKARSSKCNQDKREVIYFNNDCSKSRLPRPKKEKISLLGRKLLSQSTPSQLRPSSLISSSPTSSVSSESIPTASSSGGATTSGANATSSESTTSCRVPSSTFSFTSPHACKSRSRVLDRASLFKNFRPVFSENFSVVTAGFSFGLCWFYINVYCFLPVSPEVDSVFMALAILNGLSFIGSITRVDAKVSTQFIFLGATACVFRLDFVAKGRLMCSSTLSMMGIYGTVFTSSKITAVTYWPFLLGYYGTQFWMGDDAFYGHEFDHVTLPPNFQMLCQIMFTTVFPFLLMVFSYYAFQTFKHETLEEVRKSSEAKSAFIDYLSHEMRNSLQIIATSTEHYLYNDDDNDDTKEIDAYTLHTNTMATANTLSASSTESFVLVPRSTLEDLQTAVTHATRIVDDVLTLEKVEQTKLALEWEPFSVGSMLERTLHAYNTEIDAKGLTLTSNLATISSHGGDDRRCLNHHNVRRRDIIGDKHRIRQILCNFISNAIKFTDRGGKIFVTWNLRREAENICSSSSIAGSSCTFLEISVQDTGAGISANDQKTKLFQSFTQLRAGKMQAGGGSGLGLAICKEISKLHGGDVGCISAEGAGSTFWMRVKVLEDEETKYDTKNSSSLVKVDDHSTSKGVATKTTRVGRKQTTKPRLQDLRILIADDQIINTKLVRRTLTRLGVPAASITCVFDGDEVIEYVREATKKEEEDGPNDDCDEQKRQYDVIFLDHEMPRMNGSEALRIIRAEGFQGQVVGLTGNSSESSKKDFMAAGLDDIIIKPFRLDDLKMVIQM